MQLGAPHFLTPPAHPLQRAFRAPPRPRWTTPAKDDQSGHSPAKNSHFPSDCPQARTTVISRLKCVLLDHPVQVPRAQQKHLMVKNISSTVATPAIPPHGNYLPERECEGPHHHSLAWWSLCAVPIVASRSPVILSQMDPSQENNASGGAGKHEPTSWWNASRANE